MNKLNSSRSNGECSSLKGLCAFENGMCKFHNADNSSHSWIWTRAKDSPIKSILPKDHSTLTSNGAYVYLLQPTSSSSPKHLVSKSIPAGRVLCIQFWYFIHGSSALKVYTSKTLSIINSWNYKGSTRGKWLFGQTSVKHNTEYMIVLEGGNQHKNDFIAIDDLSFLEVECKSITPDKENLNCAFDVDMCGWKEDQGWKIKNDSSLGSLLHLVVGSQLEKNVTSPLFNPRQDGWKCVTFWFTSTLQLFQRSFKLAVVKEDGYELFILWSYNASVQSITYVQVPLPDMDSNVRVVFRGKKMQSQPVIAISKVLFLKEECQEIKPIAECHSYQVLDSIERRVSNTIIKTSSDKSLHWYTWYRISGAAGNQIPTSCIHENHCGSRTPIHAKSSNPTHKYQIENLFYCKTDWQCCQTTGLLIVRHCGNFYIYQQLSVDTYDEWSQVCSTYKEVVPVYDKSQEWDSWTNTEDNRQWETVYYNDSFVYDSIQTSPDMQEIHMVHDTNIDIPFINDRRNVLSICFYISASNGTFSLSLLYTSLTTFVLSLSNNNVVIKIGNETRSVDAQVFNGMWHHVCVTWESNWGLWYVFQDGYLLGKGMYLGDTIYIQGNTIMLASSGTKGLDKNLLIARISSLSMWSKVLSGDEIVHMSYGCNLYRWDTLLSWNQVVYFTGRNFTHLIHPSTCLGISSSSLILRVKDNTGSRSVGKFQSPWFNQSYDSNKECFMFKYKIKGKEPISLSVVQTLKCPNITDRRVWISNQETGDAWRLGRVLITTMLPYRITFKGQLDSNGYIAIGGLRVASDKECLTSPEKAKYVCNENLYSSKGLITTPNYPASYPPAITCTWNINVQQDQVIRLEFKAFDLEDSEGCEDTFLSVYDGGSLTGRYCGSIYPEILESSTNTLMLSFNASKRNVYHNGFKIYYYSVRESRSDECIQDCPSECTCIKQKDSLVVKGTDLFAIPSPLPWETTAIFFPGNKIFQLKPSDFVNLPLLNYENLKRNKLIKMDNETFNFENKGLHSL
ncbi:uncharacterized protein LOC116303676 [Actinia tenebrosa]|uniref:Uncharacterized protein LOC116303676 n=1 Tax=Actinia tenebrosa TaxID=6105 RepID=A0A6P8IQD0_ACTTE|nr:uncharacterized protein LOC116303676 [Actinia tenebrosa]